MSGFLLFLQQGPVSHLPILPVTASGWVALLGAVFSSGAVVLGWGKLLEKLNGYGERLSDVERAQNESLGHRTAMQRQIDRILDQHETLISLLGEAKRSSEKCSEETQDVAINIGSKIDTVSREVNGMNLQLSQRIKAVETILRIKGEAT